MKTHPVGRLFPLILCLLFLVVGCTAMRSVSRSALEETPGIIETDSSQTSLNQSNQVIDEENIGEVEILDTWGQGNEYGTALSADGKILAVATASGVYLYDGMTLEQTGFIDSPIIRKTQHGFIPTNAIAFSPDARFIVVAYEDILLWDVSEKKIAYQIDYAIDDYIAVQVAYDPQGKTVAVMGMGGYAPCDAWGGNYALYDIQSGELLYNDYFCPESSQFHFSFLNDGNIAFIGRDASSSRGEYRAVFVDSATGEVNKLLTFGKQEIFSVSSDGSKIAVDSADSSRATDIIDVDSEQVIDRVNGILFFLPADQDRYGIIDDGKWIITNSDMKEVCAFETSPDISFEIYRSKFNLSGQNLVYWNTKDQTVEIWDLSRCELARELSIPAAGSIIDPGPGGGFLVTSSNFLVTSGSSDIRIWDAKAGEYMYTVKGSSYDFNVSGQKLLIYDENDPGTIRLWDIRSGKELKSIMTETTGYQRLYFHPDELTLITVGNDNNIRLWDLVDDLLVETIPGVSAQVSFNPHRDTYAYVDGKSLAFRKIQADDLDYQFFISQNRFDVKFSEDWTYFAVCDNSHIELWDIHGSRIREFDDYPSDAADLVLAVSYAETYMQNLGCDELAFSPDNHILAAVVNDDKNYGIRFWDTRTGEILRDIILHFEMYGLVFSPDGTAFYTVSEGIIYVWGIKENG